MNKKQASFFVGVLLILVFLHFISIQFELYFYLPWLDIPMHFLGGFSLGILGICLTIKFGLSKEISGVLIVTIAVFTALLFGVLWEIFEFNSEAMFGFEWAEITNGRDTFSDLFCDLLGSCVGAVYFLVTKNKHP
ncbi:MAG: hypothetical protein KAS07_02185 [Candidatus Pacebacteria bacterium]|nr:hypothetical protein [Candidatus Paceibacterota bacterium]